MERTTMHIDDRSHRLDPSLDLDKLKRDVVNAVRAGGDLVQVAVVGGNVLDVLVASEVSVTFETETETEIETETSSGDRQDDGEHGGPHGGVQFDDYFLFL